MRGAVCPRRESMPRKGHHPDKRQNQEEPLLSLPQAAPVDEQAFARRAGEIIARARASAHKPKRTGSSETGAAQRMNRSK